MNADLDPRGPNPLRKGALRIAALVALIGSSLAYAGGPLYVFDPDNRVPFAYPNATTIPVYTDLGDLGPVANAAANAKVAFAFGQWTQVPTSDFTAEVAGDFASKGLPDITGANAGLVVDTDNGGGIHVLYDHDGSIIRDFFGAPDGVLGIASPEWADGATITESWAVINGAAIDPADVNGDDFVGVMTHEFGHSINLAHSQTNGAIAFFGDGSGPTDCALPYSGTLTYDHIETMYPYISPSQTGPAQSTVDHRDDLSSLSNLYPAAGWPQDAGTIKGRILLTDGVNQISGINVIARNIADPYGDAISALSGDYAAGESTMPDGSYTFNGLTPGAQYVVYVDGIVSGGFSTPPSPLPGGEEFWNTDESGQASLDPRCTVSPITAQAGAPHTADIAFNSSPMDRNFIAIPASGTQTSDVSGNGSYITGGFQGYQAPGWIWSEKSGLQVIPSAGPVKIDANARQMVADFLGDDGIARSGFWLGGENWRELTGGFELGEPCDSTLTSTYDISDSGNTVVGLAYADGCGGWDEKGTVFAYHWTPANGYVPLYGTGNWTRANAVNANGSVVVGWNDIDDAYPGRQGAYWKNGEFHRITPNPDSYFGEAMDVSADGSVIVGAYGLDMETFTNQAWRYTEAGGPQVLGTLEVPGLPDFMNSGIASVVSNDGKVVMGFSGFAFQREPFIWTEALGMRNLGEFLIEQGFSAVEQWNLNTPTAFSGNGKLIAGFGLGPLGLQGWAVKLNQVAVCHAPASTKPRTIEVGFPQGMDMHLGHGDQAGRCDLVLE
ncbi:hypothetical protein IP90_00853 [Luteimonas cucumeris]|uniref:Uncharacterized protein n=1 Tax=Luteimonas cucumeris TaxID=985012 RepID=A0A562LAT7_9GAMM|nr:hypothetical protein [Luteimonas cucumeris]TWI04718.1 hypothetical protein IP90_00853 [Luteimonas cucumeris]